MLYLHTFRTVLLKIRLFDNFSGVAFFVIQKESLFAMFCLILYKTQRKEIPSE